MRTGLIALATACGLVFALASAGFAQDQRHPSATGKIKNGSKHGAGKASLSLRGAPEARGGTFDAGTENGKIIFF